MYFKFCFGILFEINFLHISVFHTKYIKLGTAQIFHNYFKMDAKIKYLKIKQKLFNDRKQALKASCLSIVIIFILYFLYVVGTISIAMMPPRGHFNMTNMVIFILFDNIEKIFDF